jgi:dTDP-4-amino-4,6-dideoxygalactose transaminase
LYAQLQNIDKIQKNRKNIFDYYYKELKPLEEKNLLRLPVIPDNVSPNYHMFYLILSSEKMRNNLMDYLKSKGILAVFHYLPLHLSRMGKKYGYRKNNLPITENLSGRLLRLPLYLDLTRNDMDFVIKKIKLFFGK